MLYNGEEVGDGTGPGVDVAVDPVDGTRLTALGQPNALAVIALAERGSMFFPGAAVYMEKVAAGPEAADAIDITASASENVRRVAKAKGVRPEEITVTILDRERHAALITEVREVGARVFLITDGDVAGAIAAATPRSGVDLLLGIGGTPEGVIAAAALKCLGGAIQGRLWPRNDDERRTLVDQGFDLDQVLGTDDLVSRPRGVLRGDGRHRRVVAARREVLARRRDHVFDGDAFAVGNGPLRRGAASVRETRAILGDPLPPLTLRRRVAITREMRVGPISCGEGPEPEGVEMAEKTILVCDACGKPAVETVTIKAARGNFVKDLCATHVSELVSGARRPRRGRPKTVASRAPPARRSPRPKKTAARKTTAPKRRGRPRKKPA